MRRCLLKGRRHRLLLLLLLLHLLLLPCLSDRVQLRLRRRCLRLNRLHEICRYHLNVPDTGDVLHGDCLQLL